LTLRSNEYVWDDNNAIDSIDKILTLKGRKTAYAYHRHVWKLTQKAMDQCNIWQAILEIVERFDYYSIEKSEKESLSVEVVSGAALRAIMHKAGVFPGYLALSPKTAKARAFAGAKIAPARIERTPIMTKGLKGGRSKQPEEMTYAEAIAKLFPDHDQNLFYTPELPSKPWVKPRAALPIDDFISALKNGSESAGRARLISRDLAKERNIICPIGPREWASPTR